MILYNVWFSFKTGISEKEELAKTIRFLEDLKTRSKLNGYRLMKNRAPKEKSKLLSYQLMAEFRMMPNSGFRLPRSRRPAFIQERMVP